MIIEGRELRDQLNDWPLGTKFKCLGHWDEHPYYYEGLIYTIDDVPEDGGRLLVCEQSAVDHENFYYRSSRGNGYSGTWELVPSIKGKELEDYL